MYCGVLWYKKNLVISHSEVMRHLSRSFWFLHLICECMIYEQDREPNQSGDKDREVEMCDAEIFDELTTSRGELKLRSVSFGDNILAQARVLHDLLHF